MYWEAPMSMKLYEYAVFFFERILINKGYFTKYDCSSADVNRIGGIAKTDLKKFLIWAADHKGIPALKEVVEAPPTAELEPITESYIQSDEVDMGMSYVELEVFGKLRKLHRWYDFFFFPSFTHFLKVVLLVCLKNFAKNGPI